MAKKKITEEEMDYPRTSSYVLDVSPSIVHFSIEFKKKFWEAILTGKKSKDIVFELGIDPHIIEEGTWTCGAEGDVAPGTYIVSSADGPAAIEISGTHHEFEKLTSTVGWMPFGASTTQVVLLNEGDTIEVTGTVHFEPAEK